MGKKGQSTVEYILLVAAVLAVIIALTTGNNSMFQKKLTNTVETTMGGMEKEAAKLTNAINQ
jgi:hypothetical protein